MDPFDQRHTDPSGFWGSVGAIAMLAGVGGLIAGGKVAPLGVMLIIGALAAFWAAYRQR